MKGSLVCVEDVLWVLTRPTGLSVYDFAFEQFLACRHPSHWPDHTAVVLRLGAVDDYDAHAVELAKTGLKPINDPTEHLRASTLPGWYSLLEEHTPETIWFSEPPGVDEIGARFGWPVFLKGTRQTSRHQRDVHIVRDAAAYERALEVFRSDPILRWQSIACRRFLSLRPVPRRKSLAERIPASFEFRAFFWRNRLVGLGPYWFEEDPYSLSPLERTAAIGLAQWAAKRVDVPFLVVDVAQDTSGRWWVIECNDAQESGLAGISPFALWQAIVAAEREHLTREPIG